MSAKNLTVTDARCIETGKHHASESVDLEASETAARWARDQARLALYGHGPITLAAFEALRAEHTRQREGRPDIVAQKTQAIRDREQAVTDANTWVARVGSALLTVARNDETLGGRLAAALPDDDGQLEGCIGTLAAILAEAQTSLPSDFDAAGRLAEVPSLQSRLAAAPGAVGTAKARRIADTAAIDLLDGKLYYMMRDLNAAARDAIRNGDLAAALSEYQFHRLAKTKSAAAVATPTAPTPTPAPPTPL